tara:strand:- start:199 stop:1740 length:1542 start_codon:yes stop_codon:yes gene_type:complete
MAITKVIKDLTEFNPGNPDYILNATNAVTVINSGGNQYNFNGVYGKFGLRIGTTVLTGVPSAHPIAVLNNGLTGITYTGTVNEGTLVVGGITYTFYSGDVTITVTGNFGVASYYCKIHGYMGGQDNLVSVYSEAGLKMPTGAAYSGATEDGMVRNSSEAQSQGSTNVMQHFNGTDWKNYENLQGLPIVSTSAASNVASTSFTANGDLTNLGGGGNVSVGFYIGTDANYLNNTKHTVSTNASIGVYTFNATSLTGSTTYYINSFAINNFGEFVASQVTQATQAGATADPFGDGSGLALYLFENNLNDVSGNFSALTSSPAPRNIAYSASGKVNYALIGNGGDTAAAGTTGTFARIPRYNTTANYFSTTGCSGSVWINPSSIITFPYSIVIMSYYGDMSFNWSVGNGGQQNVSGAAGQVNNGTAVSINTFQQIGFTYATNGAFQFYLNGVADGSAFNVGTSGLNTGSTYGNGLAATSDNIGGTVSYYSWLGLMDNLRFFQKSLSSSEMLSLFNNP